jgi:hypothetical protein
VTLIKALPRFSKFRDAFANEDTTELSGKCIVEMAERYITFTLYYSMYMVMHRYTLSGEFIRYTTPFTKMVSIYRELVTWSWLAI